MKQRSFPPQLGAYAIKVKSEQSTHSWRDFDTARLQISVGQEYHEGDKLQAMADWAEPRFSKIQVCVNDSLQRFNLMFERGLSEEEAYGISMWDGTLWLERNRKAFSPNTEFVRWDHWLKMPAYEASHQAILALYDNNGQFRLAIDENIEAIWTRRRAIKPAAYTEERKAEFVDLSRTYLLEEITAFALMYEEAPAIDIYPGTVIFAATIFQGQALTGVPSGLGKGHFCRIDFSRRKSLDPVYEAPKFKMVG